MSSKKHAVTLIRIGIPGSLSAPAIPKAKYQQFVADLFGCSWSRISIRDEEVELSTDVARFTQYLRQKCFGRSNATALALEVLDPAVGIRGYDDLSEGLSLILRGQKGLKVADIVIVVGDIDLFKSSLWLQRELLPKCVEKEISLIVSSATGHTEMLTPRGSSLVGGTLPRFSVEPARRTSQTAAEISDAEVIGAIQVLFGAFAVNTESGEFHVPAVASVHALARDERLTTRIRQDATDLLGDPDFAVLPYGLRLGGIETLALRLVGGASQRILRNDGLDTHDQRPTLILCDFLSGIYPVQATIRTLRERGTKSVAVLALGSFEDAPDVVDTPTKCYIKTHYTISGTSNDTCRRCLQGTLCTHGEHLNDFESAVLAFDPRTFWELISQDQQFFSAGHWSGDRTPNHYQFRILSEPLFRTYGYGLAVRVRNLLRRESILLGWVKKIVCTEGEEATSFANHIAAALSLKQDAVIRIPRETYRNLKGQLTGREASTLLPTGYAADVLKGENVLIVDQAAHHFRTLSGLRQICEAFSCTVLGFVVFVDRTEAGFSLGEYLHDSHYVALYSWPCPPRVAYECPCMTRVMSR